MHNGGRQDTVFQCLKNLLYTCDIYGYVSWSYAARYFSQETFKLFKCPIFIFVVLFRAAYLKISGSLWVIVLRKLEGANKMARENALTVFSEAYLSQFTCNSRIFSCQSLWWRHAGPKRNQHLSYLLMPFSLRGGGRENRASYFKYPSLGASSKNFKVISSISIALVSPFPWILI